MSAIGTDFGNLTGARLVAQAIVNRGGDGYVSLNIALIDSNQRFTFSMNFWVIGRGT